MKIGSLVRVNFKCFVSPKYKIYDNEIGTIKNISKSIINNFIYQVILDDNVLIWCAEEELTLLPEKCCFNCKYYPTGNMCTNENIQLCIDKIQASFMPPQQFYCCYHELEQREY